MAFELDHFVWGVSDLTEGCAWMADRFGVEPVQGGVHPGLGTRNALLSLGAGTYLEIIAPIEGQPPENSLGTRLCALSAPGLLTWVLRSSDLAATAARAQLDPPALSALGPFPTQRETPDGDVLSWELLFLGAHSFGGLAPFFIDWQGSPHPSSAAPVAGALERVEISTPEAAALNQAFASIGIEQRAETAKAPTLSCTISTEKGPIHLSSTQETLSTGVV